MKAGRKREGRQEHAHSTLDHPHKIQHLRVLPLPQLEVQELVRLGGDQRGLLVRDREHEEGGAPIVFGLFPFVGLGRAAVGHLFVLTTRLLQQRKQRPSHFPPSTSAQPHLSCNPDPSQPSPTPTDTVPPTAKLHHPPRTVPYRCMHTSTPPSMPTPRGKRTLPCPSVCAAGALYREEVGLAGVDSRGACLR